MYPYVDEMTVSATPLEALQREWTEHRPRPVHAGDRRAGDGVKAQHVQYAATGKYPEDHIMLIGDAPVTGTPPGPAGCLYYPIIPGQEKESWKRFTDEALGRFLEGTYAGDYQRQLVEEFESHLPDEVPWETISGNRKVAMPRVKS
jgi:hypothetical protein